MKANIPQDLTRDQQQEIEGILRNILGQLEPYGAKQVVVCLNETKEERPAPRFVGYSLGDEMNKVRIMRGEPDPAVARFGDRPTSFMYEKCLGLKGKILELNWENPDDLAQMTSTEQAQSLKRGIKYQMLRAINFDRKWAGILGIGFTKAPNVKEPFVEALTLRDQATRNLVDYLEKKFEPGGPSATSDTDTQLEETIHQVSAGISQAFNQGMNRLAEVLRTLYLRR